MIEDLHFILDSGEESPRNKRRNKFLSTYRREVWVAAAVGVAGIAAGAVSSADASRKARHSAADAAKAGQVNINDVAQKAQDQALNNAKLSQQLEQQLTPEVSALKKSSVQGLSAQLGPNQYTTAAGNILLNQTPGAQYSASTPTGLTAAAAAAQTNLAKGNALPYAQIPTELSNLATRNALANSGGVSGGLGLGRDLTARDLGLTSLQLGQQQETALNNRISAALGTGTAQGQFNLAQASQGINQSQFAQQHALQQASALQALSSGDFQKYLAAAQLGQSIQSPVVGLDPSAIANLSVGNSNLTGQAGQQQAQMIAQQGNNQAAMYGQLAGVGAGALATYNKQQTPASTYNYNPSGTAANSGTGGTFNFNSGIAPIQTSAVPTT